MAATRSSNTLDQATTVMALVWYARRPMGTQETRTSLPLDTARSFRDDLRRLDAKLKDARAKITAAVKASGTTLTEVFGLGPVIAATVLGDVADPAGFPTADKFASYNGTAPVEASSGPREIYRLSTRGNRRLNHAIHMAAVTQIAHKHSDGHAYYQRRLKEGKTPAEARRALKRKISNAIYARLRADARARAAGPGGQPGNDTQSSATGSHPERQLFGSATPRPATTLRQPSRPRSKKTPARTRRTS
jgi:transposase